MIFNSFDRDFNKCFLFHAQAYKKLHNLKYEKNPNIRGVAMIDTGSRKTAVKRIKNSFETTYILTGIKEIKIALEILENFVSEPIVTLSWLNNISNKHLFRRIKKELNINLKMYCYEIFGEHYNIFKQIQIFLNSACYLEPIHIENSFQITLARLLYTYNPHLGDEEVNIFINEISENISNEETNDIEMPNYNYGVLKSEDVKIKSVFNGMNILEINSKNKKVMYHQTKEFQQAASYINSPEEVDEKLNSFLQNLFANPQGNFFPKL